MKNTLNKDFMLSNTLLVPQLEKNRDVTPQIKKSNLAQNYMNKNSRCS